MQGTLEPRADNFAIVIPMEDDLQHTPDKPFCWDMTCPCKGDLELFAELQHFIHEGLMTVEEATLFSCGRTV